MLYTRLVPIALLLGALAALAETPTAQPDSPPVVRRRLAPDIGLELHPSENETQGGAVVWRDDLNHVTKRWELPEARGFGEPCLMGSMPRRWVVMPYFVGGGTGAAEYRWVLIVVDEHRPTLFEMGLWAAYSVAKESYELRLSPDLEPSKSDPPAPAPRFRFVYATSAQDGNTILQGRLVLNRSADRKGWSLKPETGDDARALRALKDVPLTPAAQWASSIPESPEQKEPFHE